MPPWAGDGISDPWRARQVTWHSRCMASPPLVSIGYEGRTVGELVRELAQQEVQLLVDVRMTPLSRKPGLSKRKLSEALAAVGIDYLHLPALGNPRENREPFRDGRVSDGCRRFEALLGTPESRSALETVARLAAEKTVAVLCFERDHDRCHRQVVTRRIHQLIRPGAASVVHA